MLGCSFWKFLSWAETKFKVVWGRVIVSFLYNFLWFFSNFHNFSTPFLNVYDGGHFSGHDGVPSTIPPVPISCYTPVSICNICWDTLYSSITYHWHVGKSLEGPCTCRVNLATLSIRASPAYDPTSLIRPGTGPPNSTINHSEAQFSPLTSANVQCETFVYQAHASTSHDLAIDEGCSALGHMLIGGNSTWPLFAAQFSDAHKLIGQNSDGHGWWFNATYKSRDGQGSGWTVGG